MLKGRFPLTLSRGLVGGGLEASVWRFVGLGLGTITTLLLARAVGLAELGLYAWAMAWVALIPIIAAAGFDRLLVREIASAGSTAGAGERMASVVRAGELTAVALSLLLCGLGVAAATALLPDDKQAAFLVAIAMTPFVALSMLRQGIIQGAGRVGVSRLPEDVVRPAVFLVLTVVVMGLVGSARTALVALVLQAVAVLGAFAVGNRLRANAVRLPRSLPLDRLASVRLWVPRALPLGAIAGLNVGLVQLNLVLLGFLAESSEVGLYAIAVRIATLVSLAEWGMNAALMPAAARLAAAAHRDELRTVAVRAARFSFLGAVALAAAPLVFPGPILGLFGADVAGGEAVLRVLCLAWIVSAAAGQCGSLLTMSGRPRPVVAGLLLALPVNGISNALLIPQSGAEGAALAWLITTVVWNAFLAVEVRRQLGFWPSPFFGGLGRVQTKRVSVRRSNE